MKNLLFFTLAFALATSFNTNAQADVFNGDFETGAVGFVTSAEHMWSTSTNARTFLDNEGNKFLFGPGAVSVFTATSDDFDTAVADTTYQIDFDYGNQDSSVFSSTGTWTAELFAGGVSQGTTSVQYTGDGSTTGEIFFGTPNPQVIPHHTGFITTTGTASGALSLSLSNDGFINFQGFDNVSVNAVPEPASSVILFGLGLFGFVLPRQRGRPGSTPRVKN